MPNGTDKLRATYAVTPGAPFYLKEFGYYCLDRWISEGHLDPKEKHADYSAYLRRTFGFDEPGMHMVGGLGGTTAEFYPYFEEEQLEDRGEHEVMRDRAGRHVLYFKGRRDGFMPEYIDHPVKDRESWERLCKWRLAPDAPGRIEKDTARGPGMLTAASDGKMLSQYIIGAYMYLRSLIGPTELLYMVYDDPELIHDCMRAWLELADRVTARHQAFADFDELLFDEDICYNHAPLISYDMMREFLFPYYRQLVANIRARQKNAAKTLHIQLATDGRVDTVIDIYREQIGADLFSPCEVASESDVVAIGKKYPDIILSGGIDKRILASTKDGIDRHLSYILPAMRARGGYIPTCDHGVPEEVSFENYLYYRKLVAEYGR